MFVVQLYLYILLVSASPSWAGLCRSSHCRPLPPRPGIGATRHSAVVGLNMSHMRPYATRPRVHRFPESHDVHYCTPGMCRSFFVSHKRGYVMLKTLSSTGSADELRREVRLLCRCLDTPVLQVMVGAK
ncbi:hypothetical protein C8Q80DRAFT_459852 [Daedaleopsis nitida]|nr:hypothetical protein C8Q80DRAFT_459852 [Daedaleopsis nitida]